MKFTDKLKNGIVRFFYGRHGMDALNWAVFVLIILLSIFSVPVQNETAIKIIYIVRLVLWGWLLFRMLSKNNVKRYSENTKFLKYYNPVVQSISSWFSRITDRSHRYYKCSCGTYLRVPKGCGKIKISCSKCGRQMIKKS